MKFYECISKITFVGGFSADNNVHVLFASAYARHTN
jgi:hypothetical protein